MSRAVATVDPQFHAGQRVRFLNCSGMGKGEVGGVLRSIGSIRSTNQYTSLAMLVDQHVGFEGSSIH